MRLKNMQIYNARICEFYSIKNICNSIVFLFPGSLKLIKKRGFYSFQFFYDFYFQL